MRKYIIGTLILILSCQQKPIGSYQVEIENSLLVRAIEMYIEENQIDTSAKVITLETLDGGNSYVITNENSDLFKMKNQLIYYSILDKNKLIFIYPDRQKDFSLNSKSEMLAELERALNLCNIKLKAFKSGKTYSAPFWKVWECNGNFEINRLKEFEIEGLPCEYGIKQDSVNLDSLIIYKR